jgi:hypothetical protein
MPYRWDGLSIFDDSTSFTQHLWTCCSHYCPRASHGGMHKTAPPILNLSTIWKQVVSFRPRPSHPRGNNPWLNGPQELVWTFWRRENKCLTPASNQTLDCSTVIILLRYRHVTLLQTNHKASPCMLRMSLALLVLLSYSFSL